MIVTEPDALIADYAIRSYRRLRRAGLDFRLCVYANCLSPPIAAHYYPRWRRWPYVEIRDNQAHVAHAPPRPGEVIVSPEGVPRPVQGAWESCDTIWTRELKSLAAPYVATVDADFEILRPGFVRAALDRLATTPGLAGVATDYSPDNPRFVNTYDQNRILFLHQRWHTWFCLYRQECLQTGPSHYYYETAGADGILHAYDSAAYFQHQLIEKHGWSFAALAPSWQNQFIHYSAFSKNRRINRHNVWLYRRFRILMKRGLIPALGFDGPRGRLNRHFGWWLNDRYLARFGGVDRERERFQHQHDERFSAKELYR